MIKPQTAQTSPVTVIAVNDVAQTAATSGVWLDLTSNDVNPLHYSLAVTSVSLAGTRGTAKLNPTAVNGVYYDPGAAFAYLSVGETATDRFTYTVSDGHGGVAAATATVTITGVNQAPVAGAAAAATDAAHGVAVNLLATATDVNRDDVLSVTGLNLAGASGSVTLGAGGVAQYTPGAAFQYLATGSTATDRFGYTVSDGHGGVASATAVVTVSGAWAHPIAVADADATDATHAVTINVLANDSDPQPGQTLRVSALNTAGTLGLVVLNADGSVTYTPGATALTLKAGAIAVDTFGYTVTDGHGVSSTATASVTITGVNTPPVAAPDTASTDALHGVWMNLVANDTDINGDPLAVTATSLAGTRGTAKLNPTAVNGVYYDPGAAFAYLSVGETATDRFTYTVSDGHGGAAAATATVTITGVNQAPVAGVAAAATDAAHGVAVNLLATATDVNRDDVLSVTGLNLAGASGSVTLGAGGVAQYTPGAAFQYLATGSTATDRFGYTVSDGHGGVASATAVVTVSGAWAHPIAVADAAATDATHAVTINVLANDSDPQPGQTLRVSALNTAGTLGLVVLNADGSVTYTPGATALTLKAGAIAVDTFGYTVTDGHGVSSTATASVTITGVNTPPVAAPDTASTDALHGVWMNLVANDTDINGDPLAVTATSLAGTRGTAKLNPTAVNGVYYDPGAAFAYLSVGETATDRFTYTVSDGHGGVAAATATVTITGVNQAPVAGAAAAATDAAHGVAVNLLATATDVNRDDVLSVTGLNLAGASGSVTLGAGGVAQYTPGAAFQYLATGSTATDRFGYTVSDGHGGVASATAVVTVSGAWAHPIAVADAAATDATHAVTINVLANDSDPQPGQTLRVASLDTAGTNGVVAINPDGTVGYTPGAALAGLAAGSATTDSFGYTVSDGHGGLATSRVVVTVTAPGASATAPTAFYVATNGNDSWSGRLAAPNAAGTDGPLATLQAARALMAASSSTKTTYVEGGDYNLTTSLTLNAVDSGESWLAMPGQTPAIHGGQSVTGWTQGANGIWTAQAPAGAFAQGGGVTDLFVNGVRQTHARYPNAAPTNPVQGGWLAAATSLPGENTTNAFQYSPGDLPAALTSASGLYAAVYQQNGWESYALPVASIDTTTHTIKLAGSAYMPIDQGSRYYLYNAASQLDSPGEWFFNPANNTVSLKAPAGFTGGGVTVGALQSLVTISGADNVTLGGLTLTGSTSSGVGVYATNAHGMVIAGDTITDVGTGINLAGSGGNDVIEGSVVANADSNGILIYPGTNAVAIKGNWIHDIGQLINGNGIWFTGSSNDTITHNLVQNVARDGIGGGSAVGISDASYNDTISYNQIANTNQATSDGGGIYVAGVQGTATGDTVAFNTVYGTGAAGTAATPQLAFLAPGDLVSFGIYLDDFASGVAVHGNLLNDNAGGIDIHSGSSNSITDNIVANTTGTALQEQVGNWRGSLAQAPVGNSFSGNLVSNATPGAHLAVNIGDQTNAQWSGNFYEAAGLSSAAFISQTATQYLAQSLQGWQALGYDAGSLAGASGLVGGSETLPAGSAALAMGVTSPLAAQAGLSGYAAANAYDLFGH